MKNFLQVILFSFFSFCANAQVLINEISGNTGNNDGANDGFIELINTTASPVNIGCYVISNSEWIITLPPNTSIPANGFFTIACGSAVSPNPTPGTGLTCTGNCDFPDMPLSFDVCLPANAPYIKYNGSGFTIDNPTVNTDGEQIVMFKQDGTIADAVKWAGGATGVNDNITLQTGPYTLGTNGLPAAMNGMAACALGNTYTMPIISNSIYTNLGNNLTGCNSTYYRTVGNTSTGASAVWSTSSHLTPGLVNNAPVDNLTITGNLVQCSGANTPITLTYEIYNYQRVEQNITGPAPYNKVGSFVSTNGGATRIPWTTYSYNSVTGTTTLSYTFTPPGADVNLVATWAEWTGSTVSSSGSGSNSGTAAASGNNACYSVRTLKAVVVLPMSTSKTSVDCPSDFSAGTVNIASLITGGYARTYSLKENGNTVDTNKTGVFLVPNTYTGTLTAVVYDSSGCNPPITINISNNCKKPPTCPTLVLNTSTTTAAGAKCPGDVVSLCINNTSTNLPPAGQVEWYSGTTGFNPYTTGTLVGAVTVPDIYRGDVKINEVMYRPAATNGEWIELAGKPGMDLSCLKLSDGDWVVTIPNGTTMPASGFLKIGSNSSTSAGGVDINISTCGCIAGSTTMTLTNASTSNGEFVGLFTNSGTLIDGIIFGFTSSIGTVSNKPNGQTFTLAAVAGCINTSLTIASVSFTPGTSGIIAGTNWYYSATVVPVTDQTIERASDGTGTWQITENTPTRHTAGAPNKPLIPDCFSYTIPANACGTNLEYKAIVKPILPVPTCSATNATTAGVQYSITCPTATLSGGGGACQPSTVPLTISFAGIVGSPTYTINYTIDDVAQTPIVTTSNPYTLNAAAAGNYKLISASITGNCIATVIGSADVVINAATALSISGTSSMCNGNVVAIPVNLTNGSLPVMATYAFNGITQAPVQILSNTMYVPIPAGTTPGTYTINFAGLSNPLNDETGCSGSASGSHTVTINDAPIASATYACGSTSITINQTNAGLTTGTNTFYIDQVLPSGTLPSPNNNTTGAFTLASGTTSFVAHIENSNGCSSPYVLTTTTCPLSTQFTALAGYQANNQNNIVWQVQNQINILKYEVQYSTNGLQYTTIYTTQPINGDNYNFAHSSPAAKTYYRIKAYSANGQFIYSWVILIQSNTDKEAGSLLVFPNPASAQVTAKIYAVENSYATLKIVSNQGKLMHKQTIYLYKGFNYQTINSSNQANGSYLMVLETKNKTYTYPLQILKP
jgi:hypothetical protein